MPDPAATTATAADPRWARIVARDAAADGLFWYAVSTTGIYCRPSCPSRTARPEHVTIHPSPAAARAAGARACLRCHPDAVGAGGPTGDPYAAVVEAACRRLGEADAPVRLADLAAGSGLGPAAFGRRFARLTGLTPRAYAAACRAGRARDALPAAAGIADGLYAAGFASPARFYVAADAALGMAPARFRAGGAGERLVVGIAPCSLGRLLVAATARGIAAILMGDDDAGLRADLAHRFPRATIVDGDADHAATLARVVALVERPAAGHALPLDVRGTAFQARVWAALTAVPPGRTVTYSELAAAAGAPRAVRAAAAACAANPLAVAIPCHRAVRADGALAGYRWGLPRKIALLDREGAA